MGDNSSFIAGGSLMGTFSDRAIIVQVLVGLFLCINLMLIITFLMKDTFYTSMRYILFAVTLLSDCLILIITNLLLILRFLNVSIQTWLCLIVFAVASVYNFVTPVTLTAMTLERYVAICMPLRHGELCSIRSALRCILIIHGLSSVPCIVTLSIFFASVSLSFFRLYRACSVELFILHSWQGHLRSAISQFYFLIMCIVIVFSYIQIMKVAKAASGENKKSSHKGLRTVVLHAFQLLLCLIQLWCPFIEAAVLQTNFMLYNNVRYFNYIMFNLTPRCLSPLIYGLRDEKFSLALKYDILCPSHRNKSVSFYNIDATNHIYTFTDIFSEAIFQPLHQQVRKE
ncbi:odorant receptor 131-2-like [Archocentrus centrarchus]|uniref:odorant receptor 131-2-like n=1 Tax=Archocentrus centrarchus TaxID=63155 RepID=UPI0011EA0271|nr:odorant receptor 131-2-like [Archocentrus centrarchus]